MTKIAQLPADMKEKETYDSINFKILLVEDNDQLRDAVKNVLEDYISGVSIIEADSAETAEKRLRQQAPDIVVTDIQLPGRNGLKLTQRIKNESPQIPVIIHTNYNIREYREAAEALGTEGFFIKGKTRLAEMAQFVDSFLKAR